MYISFFYLLILTSFSNMEIDSILPSTFNKKSINCAKNFVQFQSNRAENFMNNKRAGLNKQAGRSVFQKV